MKELGTLYAKVGHDLQELLARLRKITEKLKANTNHLGMGIQNENSKESICLEL